MSTANSGTKKKALGLVELIAIALGGMVGGGIFSILGISVEHIGNATPIAILIGGILALFAAYSYIKLAILYKDEGATYSFFKKTFPKAPYASSAIGWLIVFGYISTLALYAFTFSSYLCSQFDVLNNSVAQKLVAGGVISLFAIINIISVKGMGRIEDWLVYTKVVALIVISVLLSHSGNIANLQPVISPELQFSSILTVAAITFVAYEGFQLVIHAYNEMDHPAKNIPKAIYSAIAIAIILYIVLAVAALLTIPKADLIKDKEYALAAGAQLYIGTFGRFIVLSGALLATSSAISGTLFGASRLMAVIAADGNLPAFLGKKRKTYIPSNAIVTMSIFAFLLILTGGLQVILEFGSITFILVSFLMAISNFKMRKQTKTSVLIGSIAIVSLLAAAALILYYEYKHYMQQLIYILTIYFILVCGAFLFTKKKKPTKTSIRRLWNL